MRFQWQTSCHRLDCKKRIYMQDKSDVLLWGASLSKGQRLCHLAGERFLGRVVAFEKTTLWFSPHSLAKFSTIYLLSYIQQFDCYLSGVETDGIILLVENSVLSYTCGGLHEGHMYFGFALLSNPWQYLGVIGGSWKGRKLKLIFRMGWKWYIIFISEPIYFIISTFTGLKTIP